MGGMMDGVVVVLALVVQGKDERLRCTLTHTGIPLYLDCWHESMIHAIILFLFPLFSSSSYELLMESWQFIKE